MHLDGLVDNLIDHGDHRALNHPRHLGRLVDDLVDRVDHQSFDRPLKGDRLVDDLLDRPLHQALHRVGLVDEVLDDVEGLVGDLVSHGFSLSRVLVSAATVSVLPRLSQVLWAVAKTAIRCRGAGSSIGLSRARSSVCSG